MITVDELTVKQARELAAALGGGRAPVAPFPVAIGECVLIRTVTNFYTGRVHSIGRDWIRLDDAAWIADTGRYAAALATGALGEVEPYPSYVIVGRGAIVDAAPWSHALPRATK